jgi:hypothetical protein
LNLPPPYRDGREDHRGNSGEAVMRDLIQAAAVAAAALFAISDIAYAGTYCCKDPSVCLAQCRQLCCSQPSRGDSRDDSRRGRDPSRPPESAPVKPPQRPIIEEAPRALKTWRLWQ